MRAVLRIICIQLLRALAFHNPAQTPFAGRNKTFARRTFQPVHPPTMTQPSDAPARISAREITRSFGQGHRVVTPSVASHAPVLEGHFHFGQVHEWLSLHSSDARDLVSLTSQMPAPASVNLIVVLDGSPDMTYGHRTLALRGGRGRADGALLSLREAELSVRRSRRGARTRKVSLSFDPEWVRGLGPVASPALQAFLGEHLSLAHWQPSARATTIAEQLVRPPAIEPLLQRLYLESRALELLGEAFASLGAAPTPRVALRPRDHARMLRFKEFLESDESRGLDLDALARQAATNPHTLQRQFRACFGVSVFEHLRTLRLTQARHQLEAEGVSVAQAAEFAGYTSAANFATAFKRRFGVSPGVLRARVV